MLPNAQWLSEHAYPVPKWIMLANIKLAQTGKSSCLVFTPNHPHQFAGTGSNHHNLVFKDRERVLNTTISYRNAFASKKEK